MLSYIKFIYRAPGRMPAYETSLDRDVEHTSYRALMAEIQRPGLRVLAVSQGGMPLGADNYHLLTGRAIAVLYVPVRAAPEASSGEGPRVALWVGLACGCAALAVAACVVAGRRWK